MQLKSRHLWPVDPVLIFFLVQAFWFDVFDSTCSQWQGQGDITLVIFEIFVITAISPSFLHFPPHLGCDPLNTQG